MHLEVPQSCLIALYEAHCDLMTTITQKLDIDKITVPGCLSPVGSCREDPLEINLLLFLLLLLLLLLSHPRSCN
jgi:hypothetical protein